MHELGARLLCLCSNVSPDAIDDPGRAAADLAGLADLARQHGGNRNAYSNAKGGFVERVLRGAGIEPPLRDLLPE